MESREFDQRLSQIQTHWTTIFQAQQAEPEAVPRMQRLLLRYYRAVFRYLLAILKDAEAAEELTQEFAVRFLRGDFKNATPQRGRFRDFLKTAVRHLAIDHWRRQARGGAPLTSDLSAPDEGPALCAEQLDQPFLDNWREELLARTWEALAQVESETGQPYHAVLRYRALHAEATSAQLAEAMGRHGGGKVVSVGAVRQLLHRARARFAELLVEEVTTSLDSSDPEKLQDELTELGLLDYCRSALKRRDQGG
jgi:RNA polymerase sigma-70 factor (ECF subfamily)